MDFFNQLFNRPALNQLEPAQAHARLNQSPRPYLLDVRTLAEYQQVHINGAELIPLNEINAKLKRLPKNRDIICVCASGSRSSAAARQLQALGYQVFNLNGGMQRWVQAGLPTQKGN